MTVTRINPSGHTAAIGAYSAAAMIDLTAARTLVYVSGQVASDADRRTVCPGDPRGQTEYVFGRIESILAEVGLGLVDIVFSQILLVDMAYFTDVSAVRDRYLGNVRPASILYEVPRLSIPEHLVEISVVAAR